MRYFFSGAVPPGRKILLVESGSRSVLEQLLPRLQHLFGEGLNYSILTCFDGLPADYLPESTQRYATQDYPDWRSRLAFIRQLRSGGFSIAGIVCSDELYLSGWKWMIAAALPVKIFIINENADFFWLDWHNAGNVSRLLFSRSGLHGEGAVRTLARLVLLPFGLIYLIGYAAWLHTIRWFRLKLQSFRFL